MKNFSRKIYLSLALVLLAALLIACAPVPAGTSSAVSGGQTAAASTENSAGKFELRIGYQRGGEYWNLLKAQGTLEKRFGPDVKITWALFPAGPPLLEALNAGAVDIGAVGETPPIFAQAAGAPLLYVAQQSGSGAGSAIIVPENSPLKTVADLKGKKVAFTKASSAHLLTIRALEKSGLTYGDIEPALLSPPDARAAFEGGSVDAWTVWNPFLESAIQELRARVLIDGKDVSPTKGYVIAAKPFVDAHADAVLAIIEELRNAQAWSADHLDEFSALLEKETEIPASVWKGGFDRELPDLLFIDDEAVAYQQKVADIFFELQLIPEKIDIKSVVWYGDLAVKK
ncbi:MAG: aliphatic sulfonate ABC transporter substrate-binding protein [Caldilineaceae bacterium]